MFGISSGLIIALIIIVIFFILSAILQKLGVLESIGFDFSIPLLIWKTQKGREYIDKVAKSRKKFWTYYGNLGLIVVAFCMVIIMVMIIWSAMLATHVPSEEAPTLDMVLAIPGVNPLIPLWYGIAALVIAMVVHEVSHGILARLAEVKIKALGVIFLVVPLGAFVEPDEDEIESLNRVKRSRIYAAGPTTNVILAIVLVLIFSMAFMGSVEAKEEGVIINEMSSHSPLYNMGVEWGEQIVNINGIEIDGLDDFHTIDLYPGKYADILIYDGSEEKSYKDIFTGMMITGIADGYPADDAELRRGDIVSSIGGQTIKNTEDFFDYMDDTNAGETHHVIFYRKVEDEGVNGEYEENHTNITLVDKYEAYEEMYPTQNRDEYKGTGYSGVSVHYLGLTVWDSDFLPSLLARPFEGAESFNQYLQSSMTYIALPFLGLSPIPENIANLYEVNGPLSVLPTSSFWTISNLLYWIFWLNLMVGLFNALPAGPLDGGHIFKDAIRGFIDLFDLNEVNKERITSGVTYTLGLAILFMLIWQLVGPRI